MRRALAVRIGRRAFAPDRDCMSDTLPMPVVMMHAAMRVLPAPLLQRGLRWAVRRLCAEHPDLFRRLCRLAPASILFDPVDTPHRILLTISADRLDLTLAPGAPAASACIRGRLTALLGLLEGRVDSDTLFFSRDVAISGDTATAVAFRNTLDGESISLLGDALASAGKLRAPAARLVRQIDRRVQRAGGMLRQWGDVAHRRAHRGHDTEDEIEALGAEIAALRARLSQTEGRQRQSGERPA